MTLRRFSSLITALCRLSQSAYPPVCLSAGVELVFKLRAQIIAHLFCGGVEPTGAADGAAGAGGWGLGAKNGTRGRRTAGQRGSREGGARRLVNEQESRRRRRRSRQKMRNCPRHSLTHSLSPRQLIWRQIPLRFSPRIWRRSSSSSPLSSVVRSVLVLMVIHWSSLCAVHVGSQPRSLAPSAAPRSRPANSDAILGLGRRGGGVGEFIDRASVEYVVAAAEGGTDGGRCVGVGFDRRFHEVLRRCAIDK